MATFRSFKEVQRAYDNKIKTMKRGTPRILASYTKGLSRKIKSKAPHRTGETKSGIKWNLINSTRSRIVSEVSGKGSTGFRQNMWANRTPPHNQPKMFWNNKKPTVYGDGSHVTSGLPGFFDITVFRNKNKFAEAFIKHMQTSMKVG